MTKPLGRDTARWNDCRLGGPDFALKECRSINPYTEAGPCEKPYSASQRHHSAGRGAPLRVEWPRNNHPGGFVRLAWLPSSQTERQDAHKLFDGNVQLYACFERVCKEDAGGNGGDSLGTDGGCWIDINIPNHLTDGSWTLQWTWYGGMYGEASDYYTCANFNIAGGNAVTAQQQPVFIGGDAVNPGGDKCRYFTTNKLHYCKREPCSDGCKDATAPAGHCGWPPVNGKPYIDPLAIAATPTSAAPVPATSRTPTPTVAPPTPAPTEQIKKILVLVTVKVSTPVKVFDVTTFVYSIASLMNVPVAAIDEVLVNFDLSTDTYTIIAFKLSNALGKDGKPINPVAVAAQLKSIAESKDAKVYETYAILTGLEVQDASDISGASTMFALLSLFALLVIFF
jgi:hypothetical protein